MEEWEQIARDALDAAFDVDCTPAEYREGLRYMRELIKEAMDASADMEENDGGVDTDHFR